MKTQWLKSGDRVAWSNMPKPYNTGTVIEADDDRFVVEWDKDKAKASFSWAHDQWIIRA